MFRNILLKRIKNFWFFVLRFKNTKAYSENHAFGFGMVQFGVGWSYETLSPCSPGGSQTQIPP